MEMMIMLSSTDQPYVTRKELSQAIMNNIRSLSLTYAISGEGSPIYGSLPASKNTGNHSASVTAYYDNLAEY